MALQRIVRLQQLFGTIMLGQFHLIEALVNALMALAAHPDAAIQCFAFNVLAEERAAMDFPWNQVMKG